MLSVLTFYSLSHSHSVLSFVYVCAIQIRHTFLVGLNTWIVHLYSSGENNSDGWMFCVVFSPMECVIYTAPFVICHKKHFIAVWMVYSFWFGIDFFIIMNSVVHIAEALMCLFQFPILAECEFVSKPYLWWLYTVNMLLGHNENKFHWFDGIDDRVNVFLYFV